MKEFIYGFIISCFLFSFVGIVFISILNYIKNNKK